MSFLIAASGTSSRAAKTAAWLRQTLCEIVLLHETSQRPNRQYNQEASMKPIISVIIFGLTLLAVLGNSGPSSLDNQPAILTVASLNSDHVVTFDAAFVSGDSATSTALKYGQHKTPFRLEVPSPYFFGLFKKVSGGAGIEVTLQIPGAIVRATSSTVLITRAGKKIKSEGF